MSFWRLYYHIVWATKEREPFITPEIEQEVYGYIIGKADSLGCITHAINGMADHVHVVVSIPPKLAIAEFVKMVKGSSSHHINHQSTATKMQLGWQRGYGVFSLGQKQLDIAIDYVRRQKEHHQQGSLMPALERWDDDEA